MKPTPTHSKQNVDSKRKMNEDEKTNPMCPHWKMRHNGECLKSSNKSFFEKAGHIKKNFYKLKDKKDNTLVPAKLNAANARG